MRIFNEHHELVATHERAKEAGERHTHLFHLPPDKVPGLTQTRESCLEQARGVGPCTLLVVEHLFSGQLYQVPLAGRLIRLADKYTACRLEAACKRALHFGEPNYKTIKGILVKELDKLPLCAGLLPQGLQEPTEGTGAGGAVPRSTIIETIEAGAVIGQVVSHFVYARDPNEILGHLFGGLGDSGALTQALAEEERPICR
jgi:hypothetical protein